MAGPVSRLIQYILRGKDELSPEAAKAAAALEEVRAEGDRLTATLDKAKAAQGLASRLADTRRAADQASTTMERAEARVTELQKLLAASPGNEAFAISLKEAEREAGRARSQFDKLSALARQLEGNLQAAGVDTRDMAEAEKQLAAELVRARNACATNSEQVKELERALAAANREAAQHQSRLAAVREGLDGAGRKAIAFAAAYVSVSAALGLVQKGLNLVRDGIYSMLSTGDEFEGLETRLTSLMGSIEGGEKATAWIKDFAKNTPLQLTDVTEAFALMKAFGLDPMDGALKKIEDQSEKLGGGMERLEGIVTALGQAWSKEKLQTEEVLQLIERGVPAWELLAKATGKTSAELQDLATKGKLGRDAIKLLIDQMGSSSAGAAEANMSRLSGLVSNLQDTATSFLDRIAKAGALDYVKGRLKALADTIDEMDRDGRLDKLAKSLSTAFIEGAQRVEQFTKKLFGVDFNKLTDESTGWLTGFGKKLDETAERVQLFTAPFITLGATLSGGFAQIAAIVVAGAAQILGVVKSLGETLPEAFGGPAMVEKASAGIEALNGLYEGLAQHAQDSVALIKSAWDTSAQQAEQSAQEQAETVKEAVDDQFEHVVQRVTDMNNALAQISAAEGAAQFKQLGDEILAAYQRGDLSQQEFAASLGELNHRLKETGGSAKVGSDGVTELVDKLGSLEKVQTAISGAKTDVDINNIRAALKKMYTDGKIDASTYNTELEKTTAKQKELKAAVDAGKKSQQDKTDADREAIKTSEEARRESGKRMEAERQAGDQAMQDRRRGVESAKRDVSSLEGYFGGVVSRAREPLAELSEAALEAFDKLQGISTVNLQLDTSSLEATTASLERATDALGQMQAAANTVGMTSLGRWQADMAVQSQQLQVQFLGQKRAMQELMEGYDGGSISLQSFVSQAEAARNTMGLLNDSDLRTLEGAISAAKDRMQQLQAGTRNTLASLQEELMGLRGEAEALERSRFASRRTDLQTQYADAQKSGDMTAIANLQRALGVLAEIETESLQKTQREQQEKRIAELQPPAPQAGQQEPTKVIRLQPQNGKAVDVAVRSTDDETNLLSVLESAGLRSV